MEEIRFDPMSPYAAYTGVAQRLAGLFSRSAAMGLRGEAAAARMDAAGVRGLLDDLQQHGLAAHAGIVLAPLLREEPARWSADTERQLAARLDQLAQVLEDSPSPHTEWPAMRQTLGDELLAALLGISPSSLRRYGAAERETPDDTAARLHWLAMVVSDLAGGYNALGMRRWFERPRAQLAGRSPRAALGSGWQPDDVSARQVRALAAALSGAQPLAV